MSKLKPIVTDTYDFPTLIRRGYVYVDKVELLHWMISGVDIDRAERIKFRVASKNGGHYVR